MKRVACLFSFLVTMAVCATVGLGQGLPAAGTTHNPHFIGEPFGFGEWTMDLDEATNLVANASGDAFTLVFFNGALWCPWCLSWERDMLDGADFLQFAADNNIALVEIDNPRRDGSAPTLLSAEVYQGAAGDGRNGNSGADYLAVHSISENMATSVLQRNADLQVAWTTPGAERIGYPTLVLLRKDGSIAGRFTGVSVLVDGTSSPRVYSYDVDANMARLQELLDMAGEPSEAGEELNNFVASTQDALGLEDSQSATLRYVDTKDIYCLATETAARPVVTVQGAQNATVTVALLNAAGQTIQSQSGSLATGVTLTAEAIPADTVYAAVSARWTSSAAASTASTVLDYTITTEQIRDPGVFGFVGTAISLPHIVTNVTVTVARTGDGYGAASLAVKLAPGTTAVAGRDFADIFGVTGMPLTWAAGETGEKVIEIPLLASGTNTEDKEIVLQIVEVSGADYEEGANFFQLSLKNSEAPFFTLNDTVFTALTQVTLDEVIPIVNTAGGRISVAKRSGKLPSGIRAVYDADAGGLRFTGVAKKTGEYTALFQVSERRGSKLAQGGTLEVTIRVVELGTVNPYGVKGFIAEGAVIDPATKRVTGTVKLSMSLSGRMTAKFRGVNGTVSFSAGAWSQIAQDGRVAVRFSKRMYQLAVSLGADGTFEGQMTQTADETEVPQTVKLGRVPWSKSAPAARYAGYYTASLSPQDVVPGALAPMGYSFLTLSMNASAARKGTVKYAGTLANGTSVSGSALLATFSANQGEVAVFVKKRNMVLGAVLLIDADAVDTYVDWPSSVSSCGDTVASWTRASGNAATDFDMALDVCGGYYNNADTLTGYYEMYEGTGPFRLLADDDVPVSWYGTASALPMLELVISGQTLKVAPESANPTGARLTLTKKTGIFKGTFKIPFVNASGVTKKVTATYRGVLLPGWIGDCGCGIGDEELPEKPFGMGAYWFNDRQTVTVKRGFPITIEKALE